MFVCSEAFVPLIKLCLLIWRAKGNMTQKCVFVILNFWMLSILSYTSIHFLDSFLISSVFALAMSGRWVPVRWRSAWIGGCGLFHFPLLCSHLSFENNCPINILWSAPLNIVLLAKLDRKITLKNARPLTWM